jgi:flavin-dependent dehydrogenase
MGARVVVVGAGPAGCTAAIRLAAAGHAVTLVDRHTFPRERPCAGLLFPDAIGQLSSFGVALDDMGDLLDEVRLLGGGSHVQVDTEGVAPRLVVRAHVDARLAKRAEAAGVRFVQGALVEGARKIESGVEVIIAGGDPIAADVVVAADGPSSALREERAPAGGFALYASARVAPGQFAAAAVGAFGKRPALPASVTRTREGSLHATVFATEDVDERTARARLEELLASPAGKDVWTDAPPPTSVQRVELPGDPPPARDGVLFVGEAAGRVDGLLTGVGGALAAGAAAGQALADAIGGGAALDARTLARCGRAATATLARRRRVRTQIARELESAGSAARLVRAMRRSGGARRAGLRALFGEHPSFSLRLELALLLGL